jgi:hypothetical protein
MKVWQLIEKLRERNRDDEVLVVCGTNALGPSLTDLVRLESVLSAQGVENSRHVAILPAEGAWKDSALKILEVQKNG